MRPTRLAAETQAVERQPVPLDQVTASDPWGLRLISDTTSEIGPGGVAVDIIAVHGLGANPDHAWVRHEDSRAGLEKDVRWLTDLLPQTFRDYKTSIGARIFCFNYQSAWLGPHLSRNRLEGIAVRLLDDIHNVTDKNDAVKDRPLIFIGHSFGGLVIEQAIVQANSAEGRYEYLVKLVGGVVLLGTPHQGSKSQKWGSVMATLAKWVDYGETDLMKEVDEKSMKVFDLVSDFTKIMISMDLAKTAVICFYENRPTKYLSRVPNTGQWIQRQTSSMVVEETSAVLSGIDSIVLDSDHLKLNKFSSAAQDGNYVSVSSNLCRIAAAAPELIKRRRKGDSASSQNDHFLVPPKRVKDFIGREELLEKIRSHFSSNETDSPPNLILYALGGQGKSQIALEYCRKWRDNYRGVFWIDANSATTATQSYVTIAAELLGGPQTETNDSTVQIKMVKGHLERWSEAWLLVFDNYDYPDKFVNQFIPAKGHGHVLFTSRNRDVSRLGTLLEITPLTTEEGIRLLLRGYNDNDIQPHHREVASNIVERLGGLALAIDQAAAYIKYKHLPVDRLQDFLTMYEAERRKTREILAFTPNNFWEYGNLSAFTTWELSFRQLGLGDNQLKKNSAHLLTLSAFFAPISITESLLQNYHRFCKREVAWLQMFLETNEDQGVKDDNEEGDDEEEDKDDDVAGTQSSGKGFHTSWDHDRFWRVITASEQLSLLQSISPGTGPEGASFSLHPLIRDWLQLRLKTQDRAKYTHEAIVVLECCAYAHHDSSVTLEEKTALIAHMDVSLSNDESYSEPQDKLGHHINSCNAANWFAKTYFDRARYSTSETLYRCTLKTRSNELSEKHPDSLHSMDSLAAVLCHQGNYKEAESLHRQTLMLREMELGEEHNDTLISMNNLAIVLEYIGEYKEAESMHRRTLRLEERKWGSEHPTTLNSMNNLAVVLNCQGKYEEAESIHQRVLALREKLVGRRHPSTLNTMSNLAATLADQNKYEEAELICRETLTLQEIVLGKEHPDTLSSMNNLALALTNQNKYEEAELMCRETLMLREKILGREHPYTLLSMNNLAKILANQNKYEEAEQICRETLTLQETILGKEHPDTLSSMNNLAATLAGQNKYEEAEQIYRETLILREAVLGREHPNIFSSMHGLAVTLANQNKYEEAELMFRETLTLGETVLGREYPVTLASRENLEYVLEMQGKHEEAELIAAARLSEKRTEIHDEDDEDGEGHEDDMGEGRKKERRRVRFSRWAKGAVNSVKTLLLIRLQGMDIALSDCMGKRQSSNNNYYLLFNNFTAKSNTHCLLSMVVSPPFQHKITLEQRRPIEYEEGL